MSPDVYATQKLSIARTSLEINIFGKNQPYFILYEFGAICLSSHRANFSLLDDRLRHVGPVLSKPTGHGGHEHQAGERHLGDAQLATESVIDLVWPQAVITVIDRSSWQV